MATVAVEATIQGVVTAELVSNESGGGSSLTDKLRDLQAAKDQKLISDDEHRDAKRALLNGLTQTGVAASIPSAIVMNRSTERAAAPPSVLQGFDNRRVSLTLASHPGQAVVLTGDCCLPMPCPWLVCCCSDLTVGPERNAVSFVYHQRSGQLERPEMCCQHLHVEWGKFAPESKVLSFKCGWMPCPQNEAFDLMSDGTLAARRSPNLVVGLLPREGGRTGLVKRGDARALKFRAWGGS